MRLATTAFSFTDVWLSGRYTLEALLRRMAELDLGPGLELIGFQAWRDYPALSRQEVLAFRRLVDALALEPAALGAYADLARRAGRPMTTSEAVEYVAPQVALAGDLGFPLLRLHAGIPAAVLERLAPVAEAAGVTLATEVQGGQTPESPAVAAVLDVRERVGPVAALALDFSVAMTSLPERFVETVRGLGFPRHAFDDAVALWAAGAATPELFAALGESAAPAAALDEARAGFVRFGRQDPGAWLPLVPFVAYAHAKFWELDKRGDDPTVCTAELFGVLRRGGYSGFVCSEWGGNAWADVADVDAFELSRLHHDLCRRLIRNTRVEVPA